MGGSGGNGDSTSKDFTTEDVEKEMRKSSSQKQDCGQKSLGIGAYTVNRKGHGSPFPLCRLLHPSKHVMVVPFI